MTDPNIILESIKELHGDVQLYFVGIMIAIGACAIVILLSQAKE